MSMSALANAGWTTPEAIEEVRPHVRAMLMSIPAYSRMSAAEQKQLASDMVKVLSFMRNPNGVLDDVPAPPRAASSTPATPARPAPTARTAIARAQAEDPVEATKRSLEKSPGMVGQDFKAGAVREGVEQFGALVRKVDFPKFVGGLIKNVFQAIVEASIEQMRAYGELISNVAKTVDQFMADNITQGAGRDFLAQSFPDTLEVKVSQGDSEFDASGQSPPPTSQLVAKGDNPDQKLGEISKQYNIDPPVTDISDPNAELRLVTAARLSMAKARQQTLASMVMLGINRIVVTDGTINAKVVFDMRAEDKAKRQYTASMLDQSQQKYKESMQASYGSWYTPYSMNAQFDAEQDHMATVQSAVDESSESKAEVKARLSGEVRVNFKSDYLPLEKMATPEMMSVIQGNSTPYNPNKPAAAGAK